MVKERILKYTSQVLDASFRKYKENMVNWMKYEEVEKKAIAILAQLEKNIIEDEIVVK
jgi:methyltransferase-like protein